MSRYIEDRYIHIRGIGGVGFLVGEGSKSQKAILRGLLLNGPLTGYGLHKALSMPQSTVQSAIEKLKGSGDVFLSEKKIERGRNKIYYSLTLKGLSKAIAWLHEREDRDQIKTDVSQGIKNWASICPEFFEHWGDLTDDTKRPGASDYWFDFITLFFGACCVGTNEDPKEVVFRAISLTIWSQWEDSNDIPSVLFDLKEIPEVWEKISPTLYKNYMKRETLKEIDNLLQ